MKVGLVFVPCPGAGHLLSMVELSKRFLKDDHNHCFSITILTICPPFPTSDVSATDSYIESVAASGLDIRFIDLPIVVAPFDENQSFEAALCLYIDSHKTHVKGAISQQISDYPSVRIGGLIIDLFSTTMIDVANEFDIATYVYCTSGAAALGLLLYLPILDATIESDFAELDEEIRLPGMSPFPAYIMPPGVRYKKSEAYKWFLYYARRFREMKGIMVNTFEELEPVALEALREGKFVPDDLTPPVYTLGPLLAVREQTQAKHACIEWLDEQPPGSVVFLCFGSMGSFAAPQVKEIALGLERSGHRFLWSLRCPSPGSSHVPVDANLEDVLPEGFLDRTEGRGLVWPTWVPQVAILGHEAVGGFLSHCGWNSCLESLWFGVPLLTWPLYAEQRFNAFQLVKDLGLAIDVKLDYQGRSLVSAEELERGVRCLMEDGEEGEKVRGRAKEMREASRKAVEEGGSSSIFLKQLVNELR